VHALIVHFLSASFATCALAKHLTVGTDALEMAHTQITLADAFRNQNPVLHPATLDTVHVPAGLCAIRSALFGKVQASFPASWWRCIFCAGVAAHALVNMGRFLLVDFGAKQMGLSQIACAMSKRAIPAHALRCNTGCAGQPRARR